MKEELGYVSSSDLVVEDAVDAVDYRDENDLPTLEQVLLLLDSEIKAYLTIDRLDVTDETFTIEQQTAMNQKMVVRLRVLRKMVDGAINGIKEKYKA